VKLSQQLVMTPQLQQAIQLLSKPHAEAVALLREKASGLRELGADEVDPLDALELAEAKDAAREPWLWQRLPMLPAVPGQPEADVWLTGTPLVATANGNVPRYFVDASTSRDALWALRAVRQRSRTYEKVASELVAANEPWLRTGEGSATRVKLSVVAEKIGMHASTVERVCSAGVLQSARGFTRFADLIAR
jgi:DNA-directed RNA polymerase specialized sigma54-like protein